MVKPHTFRSYFDAAKLCIVSKIRNKFSIFVFIVSILFSWLPHFRFSVWLKKKGAAPVGVAPMVMDEVVLPHL